MEFAELIFVALGLSADAFAVSVCKGLSVSRVRSRHSLICGAYFGAFQALMPLIGYFLGSGFAGYIKSVDHWIAFTVLAVIGANMIREAFGEADKTAESFSPKVMLPLAVATSIDALTVGVTLAFLDVNVFSAVAVIGITTFALSAIGVRAGSFAGGRLRSVSEIIGGVILILMGIKILIEHLLSNS